MTLWEICGFDRKIDKNQPNLVYLWLIAHRTVILKNLVSVECMHACMYKAFEVP